MCWPDVTQPNVKHAETSILNHAKKLQKKVVSRLNACTLRNVLRVEMRHALALIIIAALGKATRKLGLNNSQLIEVLQCKFLRVCA